MALGKATVNIVANLKPLQQGLLKANAAVKSMVNRAGSALRSGFSASFRVISKGFRSIIRLAKLAALAVIGIGIASVKIRADFEETSNLFRVAMGGMADAAEKWVSEYSDAIGLYEGNTKKALGTFQLMIKSMGFTEEAAFDMSKGLVKAAIDIASLRNLSIDESLLKIRAGITGESEPLKRIGILINENTIKQLALKDATIKARLATSKGSTELRKIGNLYVDVREKIKGNAVVLTEMEKVQLRYQAILTGSKDDLNDFKNTLDSTSNVFKIIKEQVQRSGDTIGGEFIDDVTRAGIVIRDWLKGNQDQIKKWASTVNENMTKVIKKLKEYFALAKEGNFEAIFSDLGRIFADLLNGLNAAFQKIKPLAFDMGKAIAEGFIASIKDTPVGKFIPDTVATLDSPKTGLRGIGGSIAAFEKNRQTEAAIGTIMSRRAEGGLYPAQTQGGNIGQQILEQLKFQTKMLTEGNRGL